MSITPTAEEEDAFIKKVAEKIHQYRLETPAIILLESTKPLMYIGGEMSRFFLSPFTPMLGEDFDIKSMKFILTLEKRENIQKLLKLLEEMAEKENEEKKDDKEDSKADEIKSE